MVEIKKWNVIFLVNENPPDKVILLRRAPEKSFAPNFYTGIGGKIGDLPGHEDESVVDSAYRELAEETEGELNRENTKLNEFARCIYDSDLRLYYFWGQHIEDNPPHIDPKDGTLIWVTTDRLLDREFIPTTQAICTEWAKRGYRTDQPFTVRVKEIGMDRTVRLVETLNIEDGLH